MGQQEMEKSPQENEHHSFLRLKGTREDGREEGNSGGKETLLCGS